MRVFISWSKEPSRSYAKLFRGWIDSVFQTVQPFMSEADIDGGRQWLSVILNELNASDFGVAFLTGANVGSNWIHYEAGAIAKTVGEARFIPVLCGIDTLDLAGSPLAYLQAKPLNEAGLLDVCRSINNFFETGSLSEAKLQQAFEVWWPRFAAEISKIDEPRGNVATREHEDPVRGALDRLVSTTSEILRQNDRILQVLGGPTDVNEQYGNALRSNYIIESESAAATRRAVLDARRRIAAQGMRGEASPSGQSPNDG
jgi:hypothetical protein